MNMNALVGQGEYPKDTSTLCRAEAVEFENVTLHMQYVAYKNAQMPRLLWWMAPSSSCPRQT